MVMDHLYINSQPPSLIKTDDDQPPATIHTNINSDKCS